MTSTDVGGVAIAWEAVGPADRPAVVMLHSLGCDRSMWRAQVDALAVDHRLVLIDMRGHGESDAPPGPYAIERLGRDVLAVADAAALTDFRLCGISIGGLIALWMAIHAPERVISAVFCNTAAKLGDPEAWAARIAAVRSGGMESVREAVMERWFMPGFAIDRPEQHAAAAEVFTTTLPEGYIGCCEALATADLRDEVASITVPTLVIGGGADVSTPPDQAEWLHEQIRGSSLTVIERAAHLSNLDQPGVFNAVVGEFLRTRP
jgi:3-oxoadipate enol-lactonase